MDKIYDGKTGRGKDKKPDDGMMHAGMAGAAADTVQRFGAGVKEHIVAYSGIDHETGKTLEKSLGKISGFRINPDDAERNLKQQAGFAAEVKETARTNAERIINGDPTRKVRVDDLGSVNDPLYDHMEVDARGNPIAGSGTQMKFVGSTPEDAWAKINSSKFQKYHDNNVPIEVPSDHFDRILAEADRNIGSLEK